MGFSSCHSVSSLQQGMAVSSLSRVHICVLGDRKYQDCKELSDRYFSCKNKMGEWVTLEENELHLQSAYQLERVDSSEQQDRFCLSRQKMKPTIHRMSTISLSLWEAVRSSPVGWYHYYYMLLFHTAFGEIAGLSGLCQTRLPLIKIASGNIFAKTAPLLKDLGHVAMWEFPSY